MQESNSRNVFFFFKDNIADVKDIDCEFLPLVYEIVKRVEKDPNDASAKNKVNYNLDFVCYAPSIRGAVFYGTKRFYKKKDLKPS